VLRKPVDFGTSTSRPEMFVTISKIDRLHQILTGPEQDIDLVEAALLIAAHIYPELDIAAYSERVDELAKSLDQRTDRAGNIADRIHSLNEYLFHELGFAPNGDDYYDPRNSFLNEVLERKVGIPISLSLLYMEIGQRIGLEMYGVSFPGHFLVKCALTQGIVVLDPYARGVSLSLADLQQRLRENRGGEVSKAIVAGLLVAAGKKDILVRMLRNLKAIYMKSGEAGCALQMLNAILLVSPDATDDLRDRGLMYQKLECFRAAADDLDAYLSRVPDAKDAGTMRLRLMDLNRQRARLN
jgi:regulator of sirC expression with transglutaminase-like and TPR domain